nr:B-box zinc finger protein 20 [Ipomoea batatas]
MKIQCDVCEKEEASFFCSADEAALCIGCDHQVHHANKLATKHLRFSLLHPTSPQSQLCDICQERRALLFCKEDRAILCRDCDLRMHKANEHTQKHNRFLLTGVKLSSFDVPNQLACSPSSGSESSAVSYTTQTTIVAGSATYETSNPQVVETSQEGLVSDTSSISEYLLETLPGWHVQDFLDYPSSSTTYDFFCILVLLEFNFSRAADNSFSSFAFCNESLVTSPAIFFSSTAAAEANSFA